MGKTPKIDVVDYYMSSHWAIAAEVDELLTIWAGEKEAWNGSLTDKTSFTLDRRDLFGGQKKEGGLYGLVTWLPGRADQTIGDYLASKMGLTSATSPGYRGLASLFFSAVAGTGGFLWSSNTPYLQAIWATVRRAPKGLSAETSMIGPDANAMHIIYEVLTNRNWGLGASPSGIDTAKFQAAAQTIFDEAFGISLAWTQPTSGEDFIQTIVSHVNAMIYLDPRTGLITPKLIRGDYDVDDLFEITIHNAKLSDYQRKLFGETINEIVTTWTNPETEEEETVSLQDLANIGIQGAPVSDPRGYPGIRNADLAMQVTARDLRVASAPLMTCMAALNRTAGLVTPGQVVAVTWPKYGMVKVPMRCGEVDYGKTTDSVIRIPLTEDIFSFSTQHYVAPKGGQWRDISEVPAPLEFSLAFTLPFYMVADLLEGSDLAEFPDVIAGVLAGQAGVDTNEYQIVTEGTNPAGEVVSEPSTGRTLIPHSTLTASLSFEAESTIEVTPPTRGGDMAVGCFVLLGDTDQGMELCVIMEVDGFELVLKRGVLDTIPRAWPANTPLWILPANVTYEDVIPRIEGELVEYKLLSVTSLGTLAIEDATEVSATMTARPWLPTRPADVEVGELVPFFEGLELIDDWDDPQSSKWENEVVSGMNDPDDYGDFEDAYILGTTGVGVRIYSDGDDGCPVEENETYRITYWVKEGTDTETRFEMRCGAETSIVEGTYAVPAITQEDAGELDNLVVESLGGGIWKWIFDFKVGAGFDTLFICPGNKHSDQTIIILASSVKFIKPAHYPVTWANRNRLTEDTIVLAWDDASVTPETGQTTSIIVKNLSTGSVIITYDDLTGTSFDLFASAFLGSNGSIKVISKRDDLSSLQGREINVYINTGYGRHYGYKYGG